MGSSPLDVSPLASFLLELATSKATGRIVLAGRAIEWLKGTVVEISALSADETIEHWLQHTAGVLEDELADCRAVAANENITLPQVLVRRGVVSELELREGRRSLFVDRLARALRTTVEERPSFEPLANDALARGVGLPLAPLLLDALVRAQASSDARLVSSSLNHRIEWVHSPHAAAARDWADFGEGPEQPAISTLLAKRPLAASRIVALLRTGLMRLVAPGRTLAQTAQAGELPEPPPRIDRIESSLGTAAVTPSFGAAIEADPIARLASSRPPRLRLDPGSTQPDMRALEPTPLVALPEKSLVIDDPLLAIEQRIAELEQHGAPGPERARAFTSLADVWRDRLFSTERACRAFREAAAADSSDSNVLQQAALHCHYLGQTELAIRYAAGAVHAASIPVDRAAAQRLRAGIERVAGRAEACVEALCEAAADDPSSPGLHEQVATLLFESGNLEGANAHARLAAAAIDEGEQERRLTLLAWAFWLKPDDPASAYEYASLLDETGRKLGAVTILADTASRTSEVEPRRKLRLSAAERALAAERPDIAAELSIDVFDAEPELEELHARLDARLRALEFPQLRAAVLEDVATVCSDDRRSHWLARAGEVLLDAPDQHEAAIWLFLEALLTEPSAARPLGLLREHARAPRELVLFAHGLGAAIAVRADDDAEKAALLEELAGLAEARLDNPELALAAWAELARTRPERKASAAAAQARLAAQRALVQDEACALEAALGQAAPAERAELSAKLAVLLPDMPEHRARKIELLSEAQRAGTISEPLCALLETLHGLNRDAAALAEFLELRAEHNDDPVERARLLARLCAVHTVREDNEAVARTAESLLVLDGDNLNAIARLLRAARKLGDPARLARALSALASAEATPQPARARALAQLAAQDELLGRFGDAARHAAAALAIDPLAADAGLILLRHTDEVEPRLAAIGLQVLRDACGASRALLAKQAELAEALGDRAQLGQIIERWLELLPHDAAAHRTRILLACEDFDPLALLDAASTALSLIPCATTLETARVALERLAALGSAELAVRLGLRLAEEQGRLDYELATRVLALAEGAGNPDLITAALELASAAAPEERRAPTLLALAAHHERRGAYGAEVRALLRVLEGGERHAEALERLRELFARGGEGPRLLAVVMLMLELSDDPERRRTLLLELTAISAVRLDDRERAEHYVRMLIAENPGDDRVVRAGLGVFFSLGDASFALERCQAIAEACPPELGSRICTLCAITAEQRLQEPDRALEIARRAALRWPTQAEPLLLIERLTLKNQDASTALSTYDALIAAASGPHGRRALLYRAGRWLERAGLLDQALERYARAFELAPTSGAAFTALSRVARETGHLERLVPCYETLAEQIREPRARVDLLARASELCLDELHDGRRGLALLLRANELSERAELDERVLERSRGLLREQPQAATEALERLGGQLAERAAQLWNGEDKVRCLVRLASLYSQDLNRHGQALAQIDEALAIAKREGLSSALAADAESERSAVIARASQTDIALATEASGDRADAPEPASAHPATFAELRERARSEPWRTQALRDLHAAARVHGSRAERYVLDQLIGVFDGDRDAPEDLVFAAAKLPASMLEAVLPAEPREVDRALGLLWERARTIPRFRQLSQAQRLNERDRIARVTAGALADAYARAARALGRGDVPVYVVAQAEPSVQAIPTHPPAVLLSRDLSEQPSAATYRIAHALFLAHPEHVIGGVLARKDAADLLRAVRFAFVPDQAASAASPADKELAAALWQNLPSGDQRLLSVAVRNQRDAFEYPEVRARSRIAAARAALLTSGGLRAALSALSELEPELSGLELERETDFARGCQLSPVLCETVRCALSEDYLGLLERALATN